LGKDIVKIDEKINASLKEFFGAMLWEKNGIKNVMNGKINGQ
jgi:hypothetical protein